MYRLLLMFILFMRSEAVIYRLNESEYNRMPPLYALDDYDHCMGTPSATYCVIDVDLQPGNNEGLMNMIQEYSDYDLKHFNHTQIHRGVCVISTCGGFLKNNTKNETDLDAVLEACLNSSLQSEYGLEGKLSNIQYCYKEGEQLVIDTSDVIMAVVYLVLILVNIVGSFYDILNYNKDEKVGNPYLLAFSVRRNWARLTASSNNVKEPRLERLKLFHGLRTMTMICVIFSHTTLMMSASYVDNPLYIETAYDDLLKQLLFNGNLVTQTFFLMSSFLLAYNFMLHAEKHPISWMHLPKGILLRWLRLTPAYALVLGTIATWMRHLHQGPLWRLLVTSEADACRQYWWAHVLYINNYIYDDAFCMPQTWYLASDTQLFCLGLLVCLLARSCKARVVALSALMVVALAIVAGHTYFEDLDAMVLQTPESYRNLYATNPTFRLLYSRGHTNISACVLGLAGGFLTYHWQDGKTLDKYKKYRWAAWLMFPLGVLVVLSGGLFYSDAGRAPAALRVLYATFYKSLFQLIVLALIISCIFKIESVYRGILEWRGFSWGGRASYSAFLLHTLFQRALGGAATRPLHMTDYYVVIVMAATILLSYICAALLWLCLEAPAANVIRTALAPRGFQPREKCSEENGTKL